MVYSLESFENFINLIYVFLPVITLDRYIHNLHENLRRTKMTLIILTIERELGLHLFPKRFWWLNCPTQIIGLTSFALVYKLYRCQRFTLSQ
jgi:hypothetical protein